MKELTKVESQDVSGGNPYIIGAFILGQIAIGWNNAHNG